MNTENKVVEVILENGTLTFLATNSADVFLEQGKTITRRASHVEPVQWAQRIAFHFLRLFGDKTKIAEWTRHWQCDWRVNTKPVGGPVLKYYDIPMADWKQGMKVHKHNVVSWLDRQQAIDAEVKFLNQWFAR